MSFITKDLPAAIMNRGRVRNNFLRNTTNENQILYTKQRDYCLDSQKIKKEKYIKITRMRRIVDNKLFQKTVKLSLSNKVSARDLRKLSQNGETVEAVN